MYNKSSSSLSIIAVNHMLQQEQAIKCYKKAKDICSHMSDTDWFFANM